MNQRWEEETWGQAFASVVKSFIVRWQYRRAREKLYKALQKQRNRVRLIQERKWQHGIIKSDRSPNSGQELSR